MNNNPNVKRGFRYGAVVTGICLMLFTMFFYWVSLFPVTSEVSLSLAFRPRWKTFVAAIQPSIICGFIVGLLAAYRP